MANHSHFMGMQPRTTGQVVNPPSPHPPMPMQFRPGAAPPPPQPFVPQQFQQYPPVAPLPPQQQPQRPSLVGPPLQNRDFQPIRPLMSSQAQALPQPQISNSYMQPYTTNIPSYIGRGQSWFPSGNQNVQAVRPPPQQSMEQGAVGQTWYSSGNPNINPVTSLEPNAATRNQTLQSVSPSRQSEERNCGGNKSENTPKPDPIEKTSSDWREYTSPGGKKFYYNKRTRMSSWEKPLELMTPNERADASTDWQEVTIPDGRKFYYNKVEKISHWRIPDEVKLARDRANQSSGEGRPTPKDVNTPHAYNKSSPEQRMAPSPSPVANVVKPENAETSESPNIQEEAANLTSDATDVHGPLDSTTRVQIVTTDALATPVRTPDTVVPMETAPPSANAAHNTEEVNESSEISDSGGASALEVNAVEHEPTGYESKEEAKSSFKDLLEMSNVGSSWSWDQAMRLIINDKRYAALKTLEERKQAFNEFVEHKKTQEADENRAKQEKAQEDFKKMLEESKDLTSLTKWSQVVSMFENDERFQAVERVNDREDLFADYMEELKKKERSKALEEHKRNVLEYLEFLKSCDFIKASSQWRKVQNRLEADERCSRLEKIERLELFQEYVRDLEKEEEEQIKLRMEEQRKAERKNRDEFRKLMEEHVANGIVTSKTVWRDYCIKVQDTPAYLAVYSNTSGCTAKDLFDDVVEDLDKQYAEDKERIEDAVKSEKISLSTSWTIEDFKTAIAKEISSKPIEDINLKLVFDELLEKAKEKEEKEAKKRKRLTDDVYEFLYNSKDVSASSKWEDCKPHVEEKFIGEESFFQDIFDKLIAELKEKDKEKERKRKEAKAKKEKERKDREKKEKDRKNRDRRDRGRRESRDIEKHKKEGADSGGTGSRGADENRRSRDKEKNKKERTDSGGTGSRGVDESRRSRDKDKHKKEGTDSGGTGSRGNKRSRDKDKSKKEGTDSGGTSSRGNKRSRDKGKSKKDGTDSGGTSSRGTKRSRDKEKSKKEGTDSGGISFRDEDETRRSRDRDRKHRKRRRTSPDTVSLTNKDDRSKSHRHSVDSKKSKKVERQSSTAEADTGSRRKRQRR